MTATLSGTHRRLAAAEQSADHALTDFDGEMPMKKTSLATALMLAIATPAAAQTAPEVPGKVDAARVVAGAYKLDTNHSQVVFSVNHFGFNVYHGLFGGLTGMLVLDPKDPTATMVAIDIPLANVVTTSEELNKHLKAADFFNVEKYPTASFKSTSIAVSGTSAKITGNLTLHGVTRPAVLDARFTGAGTNPTSKALTAGFEATTSVRRSEFGMNYALPLVADQVDLRITAAFEKAD